MIDSETIFNIFVLIYLTSIIICLYKIISDKD